MSDKSWPWVARNKSSQAENSTVAAYIDSQECIDKILGQNTTTDGGFDPKASFRWDFLNFWSMIIYV